MKKLLRVLKVGMFPVKIAGKMSMWGVKRLRIISLCLLCYSIGWYGKPILPGTHTMIGKIGGGAVSGLVSLGSSVANGGRYVMDGIGSGFEKLEGVVSESVDAIKADMDKYADKETSIEEK